MIRKSPAKDKEIVAKNNDLVSALYQSASYFRFTLI
jgi:hypothetical protein